MAFLGPLPVTGPWTAVGLGRGQFVLILVLSVALFVGIDGALWHHVQDAHLRRLALSYAVIPPAVAAAQASNGTFGWGRLLGATVTLAVIKLVLTAVLLAVLGMAR